jgi:hypothetical protein
MGLALDINKIDVNSIRLKIVKSMLAEFPELKVQITKSILIEPNSVIRNVEEKKVSLKEYLNSKNQKSIPDWAKLAIASKKKNKNVKDYYVFK